MPVSDVHKSATVEVRSIDYVPDRERHGGLASQFTWWLAAKLQITAIVTGALAVVFGGDVFWSLVSLGSTGAVAGLLYFSVAFGKVTVTSLNAYGSFMSMATMVSGIAIYLIGILVQIRFLATAFYTGPLVDPPGDVDISWIVGLLVAGALYYAFAGASRRRAPPQLILPT